LSPSASGPSGKPELGAKFVASYPDATVRLDPPLPEIALLGRSNVGKSSLLNALTGKKGLAKVSATPGKTRLMNVFRLSSGYLLDLPGYGWAKASQSERAGFRKLLETCLRKREDMVGVVWLVDIRHPPSEDDYAVQALLVETGRPALTVLTKADKFARGQRLAAARARARDLGLDQGEILVTSSRTGEGIGDLRESIRRQLTIDS
jgi:GTP-binding protein